MPNVKISDLPAASSAAGTDQLETNQSGTSRRLTVAQVATHVRSTATDTVVVAAGSASAPSIAPTGDSNTGIFFPAADTIAFAEGGVEAMRIDSAGNVGIGTSSPDFRLTLQSSDAAISLKDSGGTTRAYIGVAGISGTAPTGALRLRSDQGGIVFVQSGVDTARIDTSSNFAFNSGYGSVATAFGCRAWVNFNGTGTVAIRASGNVSSITDNGVGDYTVNFTNAMPNANYALLGTSGPYTNTNRTGMVTAWPYSVGSGSYTASSVRVGVAAGGPGNPTQGSEMFDSDYVLIAVFR